ncbi:MAG: heme-dependent peroxidase [Planctomycetia bacterium]|nr:heme-dependent peroxidase [Planctomycetia bacterium]
MTDPSGLILSPADRKVTAGRRLHAAGKAPRFHVHSESRFTPPEPTAARAVVVRPPFVPRRTPVTHPPAPPHPASRPAEAAPPADDVSFEPAKGWHVSHLFYAFDRARLAALSPAARAEGARHFVEGLDPAGGGAPRRLQTWIVPGHKADFGVMAMDPSPLRVEGVHQRLLAGPLGQALACTWSFIGLTEVSEYVPTVEQYAQRLVEEGEVADSPSYRAKVQGYAAREESMRRARMWPNACFYPMNKKRDVGENWFTLPFAERSRLMAEHGRTGMSFGGRVTQLITVSVGLDDWEWGVTLWARRPDFLKDIVYRMRFDEASARYAEFGPFYTGYVATAAEILAHCQVGT